MKGFSNKRTLRIALFMPAATPFYMSTLFAMKRGFEKHNGVEVIGWTALLEEEMLLEFCRQYKPDVVFEMNRSRGEIPYLPRHIKHISWIVDPLGNDFNSFFGSEILYFFSAHWIDKYTREADGILDWLVPGFCPDTYKFAQKPPISDFSFFGHIPLPWAQAERDRIIFKRDGLVLTLGKVYDLCLTQGEGTGFDYALSLVEDITGEPVEIEDRILRYDMGCRASRMIKRQSLINTILDFSESLRIYGSENWKQWPRFQLHYEEFISDPRELCHIIQTSKIILHEGSGLHFRVFDSMAAGACVFYLNHSNEDIFGGIRTFFDPGKHYVSFKKENISELATYYLHNETARNSIVRTAAKNVHANHKWSDRAAKILEDIDRIL